MAEGVEVSERGPERPAGWSAPGWSGGDGARPSPDGPPPDSHGAGSGWDKPPQYGPPTAGAPPYGAPPYPPGSSPGYGPPAGWGGPPAAPRPGVVPLRPLGLGELLDGSVGVVRRYPRPTLGLSLAVSVLTTAVGVLLVLLVPVRLFGGDDVARSDGEVGGLAVSGLAASVVAALAGLVLAGMITVVVGRAVLGEPLTTARAWAALRPRLGRLVLLTLATGALAVGVGAVGILLAVVLGVALGPGGLVLGVPLGIAGVVLAVYVYVRLSLAGPALVLEKVGVREAMRRSGVLVRGSFWRVFGVLLLAGVIAAVVAGVLQVPFAVFGRGGVLTGTDTSTTAQVLGQLGRGLAQVVTAPFTAGVTALLYVDRRMRAEGLDLVLAGAAGAAGPAAVAPR